MATGRNVERFQIPITAERRYISELRGLARQISKLIGLQIADVSLAREMVLNEQIAAYEELIAPWARQVSGRMIDSVANVNRRAWLDIGGSMPSIKEMLQGVNMGSVIQSLQAEQVELIKTLPRMAAEDAQKLILEARSGARRSSEVSEIIAKNNNMLLWQAERIARTETAKVNSMLTRSRAEGAGIEYYTWETARDQAVRQSHKDMQGRLCRFDTPPEVADEGAYYHAGETYNCRCFPAPYIEV